MSPASGQATPDALLLDEMFSPRLAEQLRTRGIDCIAVADDAVLSSQDDQLVLEAALATGRVLVTNNVVDFEPLRTQRTAGDQPIPPLIYTSENAFPRNRKFIRRLVEALDYAVKHRLVHTTGGVLWLTPPPPSSKTKTSASSPNASSRSSRNPPGR
jgi:predicted nuclease of predicted toxin-antitoxin system